ncbi:MAG: D-2-hydroxyacid dehydrogenase [Chloroflexota bacterium]
MKVVIYGTMKDKHLETVRAACPTAELVIAPTEAEARSAVADADGLCLALDRGGGLREVLRSATRLRWMHCFFAGVENILVPELVDSDIVLTNAAGVHAPPIAEHVIGMIIALARSFPALYRQQREHVWYRNLPVDEIAERTVGIVGLGGIGRLVAKKAKGLDMRVIGTKRHPQPVPFVDEVLPDDRLEDLLAQSDYVVVAVPSTPDTVGLIGRSQINKMKPSAHLINVARGNVIDQEALITALQDGRIAGAGLDVFEPEPLPADSPLWSLPNVILTPHCSARSPYINQRTVAMFAENLRRFAAGEELLNVVDKQRGY